MTRAQEASAQAGKSFTGGFRLIPMKHPKGTGEYIADIVDTAYLDPMDRYVVALIVGYSDEDMQPIADGGPLDQMAAGIEKAALGALELTRDAGSGGTRWYVWDRLTESGAMLEQKEFDEDGDDEW